MYIGGHEVVTATRSPSCITNVSTNGKHWAPAAQNIHPHEKGVSPMLASACSLESRSSLEHREGKLKQRLQASLC